MSMEDLNDSESIIEQKDRIDEEKANESTSTSRVINRFFARRFELSDYESIDNESDFVLEMDDPPEGTPEVWTAAVHEDWPTLKQCLDENPLLIEVTGLVKFEEYGYGRTCEDLPLMQVVATWSENEKVLRYLVSLGADVNSYHESGLPLHYVLEWSPNMDAAKYLVSVGADINTVSGWGGGTPLFSVVECSDMKSVRYFIANGADVHARTLYGATMLHAAANNRTESGLEIVTDEVKNFDIKF